MHQILRCSRRKTRPVGLKWRSSSWTITFVIGLGISVDLLVYSIIIPVMPFHLEQLGYHRVAALSGWLLFAYSAGLVLSTIPIAMFSERYNARQAPLISGLFILVGSQVMLMEAPNYPVMCVARILQGVGSSLVWVVGLALLCDSAPPAIIGLQLGCAMGGLSIGFAIGPSVGGALYGSLGYRAPFIFGIAAAIFDLIGRLVIIERKEALHWGVDPAIMTSGVDRTTSRHDSRVDEGYIQHSEQPVTSSDKEETKMSEAKTEDIRSVRSQSQSNSPQSEISTKNLSLLAVIFKLAKSSRALVTLFIVLIYGVVYSSQEPTIPLHLQRVWNLDSRKVGLVFIAAVVPTLFSSPITGFLTDKYGAEWVTVSCLLLALPWWGVVIIQQRLALFVVAFAVETLFTSGVISPLTAELAAASRDTEGVGYAHVYGAFNLVYGIGTSLGPVVGGQMYDHVDRGWMALCLIAIGLLALCSFFAFAFVGGKPLLHRLLQRHS